jgi:hypothetical protein
MANRHLLALALVAAVLPACDDGETENPEEEVDRMVYWEQQALEAAKKNAAFELGCEELSAETLDRNDAVMVKWYSFGITGCGKKALYEVTCANQNCDAERKGEITDAPAASDAAGADEAGTTEEAAGEEADTDEAAAGEDPAATEGESE